MAKDWLDVENVRLLQDTDAIMVNEKDRKGPLQSSSINKGVLSAVFLLTLLVANSILFLLNWTMFAQQRGSELYNMESPASEALLYQERPSFDMGSPQGRVYTGPPSDENIKAWEDIIQPTFFSATEQELVDSGAPLKDSVKLAQGGYLASLGVYHEIHCLRQLRLFLYSDTFYPNLNTENIAYLQHHLGHCLEAIRKSLMCVADVSLYTFQWVPSDNDRPHPRSNSSRKCVDWDSLASWADDRKVSLDPVLIMPEGIAHRVHM